jgi:16S rRNA G527 N7-methylase RsmG
MWSRAEDFGLWFDIVIARAVAMIDKLITRTDHLVLPWWIRLLFKPKSEEEFFMLQTILKRRKNLTLEINHEYTLFEWDIPRIIYWIRKK